VGDGRRRASAVELVDQRFRFAEVDGGVHQFLVQVVETHPTALGILEAAERVDRARVTGCLCRLDVLEAGGRQLGDPRSLVRIVDPSPCPSSWPSVSVAVAAVTPHRPTRRRRAVPPQRRPSSPRRALAVPSPCPRSRPVRVSRRAARRVFVNFMCASSGDRAADGVGGRLTITPTHVTPRVLRDEVVDVVHTVGHSPAVHGRSWIRLEPARPRCEHVEIRLVGEPEIVDDDGVRRPLRGHQSWALLARIVLSDRPLSRRALSAELFHRPRIIGAALVPRVAAPRDRLAALLRRRSRDAGPAADTDRRGRSRGRPLRRRAPESCWRIDPRCASSTCG
jgi:hypothetical protein